MVFIHHLNTIILAKKRVKQGLKSGGAINEPRRHRQVVGLDVACGIGRCAARGIIEHVKTQPSAGIEQRDLKLDRITVLGILPMALNVSDVNAALPVIEPSGPDVARCNRRNDIVLRSAVIPQSDDQAVTVGSRKAGVVIH